MYLDISVPSVLNFLWYLFVIVLMGQLGPLMVSFSEFWRTGVFYVSIDKSAANGELILCSTAILASGIYFLVKEYNSRKKEIVWRSFKSVMLLWSSILGLTSIFVSYQLLSQHAFSSDLQTDIHWAVYWASLVTATVLWLMEELEAKAKTEVEQLKNASSTMTAAAMANTSVEGVKI